MKILISRSSSFVCCRFIFLAQQYNWSAKTVEEILTVIFKWLGVPLAPPATSSIPLLSPGKLRRLVSLCQVICQNPDYFDYIFNRFSSVPVMDLQRIIDLDRKYVQSLNRREARIYLR